MPAVRKSTALHELHNTKPHNRSADESHVEAGRPRFPKDLGKELRPVFKRLCRLLAERRSLTAADGELLRLYCFQYERHEKNAALLRQEGELCTYMRLDSNGVAHPQVKTNLRLKVVTDAERQMAAILNQLGLNPTAKDRARPTGKSEEEKKPVDPMEEFLGKRSFTEGLNVVEFTPTAPPTELESEPEEEELATNEDGSSRSRPQS